MDRFDQKNMRRRVARTLLVSTLVFFLLLGGAFYLQREIPLRRLARIEALLDAGDYAAARPLTERVDDEALAEGFRARCDYLEGVQLMDSGRWAEARELLKRVDLTEHADKVPCELSGGQQQRVAIARALAMHPDVMYFDEATSALDPKLTADMHRLIREFAASGMAVGIVTHEMGFAREVSDRVCFLIDGTIVEEGTPEEVIEHPKDPRTKAFLAHAQD